MGASQSKNFFKATVMERNPNNPNKEQGSSVNRRPLSIEAARAPSNANQMEILSNQPRQPTNLQGLLRFAMEATTGEDAPNQSNFQPIDEERKKFLDSALSSMTVNVIEELQKDVSLLKNVMDLRNEDDASEYEAALERIADRVDSLDVANDFYKIGGFSILGGCLNSAHSGIRWRVANLIAELAQNNPACQDKILEAGFLPILLNMVDSDSSDTSRVKALYAISCIVRGLPIALKHMTVNDGFSVLIRAIQSPVEKLQIKAAFLLSTLCRKDDIVKLMLVKMGLVEQASGMLAMANLPSETREQLLSVLNGMTDNNYFLALKECRRPELCLKQTLERHLKESKKDGSIEIEDLCKELLDKIFADQEVEQER